MRLDSSCSGGSKTEDSPGRSSWDLRGTRQRLTVRVTDASAPPPPPPSSPLPAPPLPTSARFARQTASFARRGGQPPHPLK